MFDEDTVIYRYKYLPFSDGSLETITSSTIKFTCPLDFNDPFDCFPSYEISHLDDIPKRRPDLFKKAGDQLGFSPAQRLQNKGRILARMRARMNDPNFFRPLLREIGVVSLSRFGLSIPMWSHYADFHRGFLLEFRIPTVGTSRDVSLYDQRLTPLAVQYQANRPQVFPGIEAPDDLITKALLTKSLDWEYEAEERVIDRHRGSGIHSYRRDDILVSVIAGMKMGNEQYERLSSVIVDSDLTGGYPAPLFRAQEVRGEYRLTVPGHPRLDRS